MELKYKENKQERWFYTLYFIYVTAILLVFSYYANFLLASILWGIPGYGFIVVSLFIKFIVNRKNLDGPDIILSEETLRIKQRLGFYMEHPLSDLVSLEHEGKFLALKFSGPGTPDRAPKVVIDLDRIPEDIAPEFETLLEERAQTANRLSEPLVTLDGTTAIINLNGLDSSGLQRIVDKLKYLSKHVLIDAYCIEYPGGVINRQNLDMNELESLLG